MPDWPLFQYESRPFFVSSGRGPYGGLDLDLETAHPEGAGQSGNESRLAKGLGSVPLILPLAGLARLRFDRWARGAGIKPHIAAETAGNEAVLALARLGIGLGLVPRIVLENSPFADGLVIYAAGPGFGDYDIGFILRLPRGETEIGGRVVAAVTAILGSVYPEGSWRA